MVQWPGNKKARKIRGYSSPKLEPFDSHFGASLRAPFDARDPSASLGINPSASLGINKRGKLSVESFPSASNGGAEGIRTLDLLTASQARSQLRHSPKNRTES